MTLDYWFMFPIALAIATLAMASGVEGATFFTPLFILVLGLSPEVAIGTGLITAVFGSASGFLAYARKRLIDYRLGRTLLITAVPMGILGAALSPYVYPDLLKAALSVMLITVGLGFRQAFATRALTAGTSGPMRMREQSTHQHSEPHLTEGRLLTGLGGLFLGLISTGLGQLNGYYLIQRSRVPGKIAVATSVFIVSVTALIASAGHFLRFVEGGEATLNTVLSLVAFTVPGVLIGGQIGPRITDMVSQRALEQSLAVLFVTVALILIIEVIY